MSICHWIVFFISSFIQIHFVAAAVLPSESPDGCVVQHSYPCSVVTGFEPRMIQFDYGLFELDRNLLLVAEQENNFVAYKGMMVVTADQSLQIKTPFAEIHLGQSKVMIHILENQVRVLSLSGEGVKVVQPGVEEVQLLLPGFQNWFGGLRDGQAQYGVASVIDLSLYAKDRARIFMNHNLGFRNDIVQVASVVKGAAQLASQINRDLLSRKIANIVEVKAQETREIKKENNYDQFLRRLFLKKMRYDD